MLVCNNRVSISGWSVRPCVFGRGGWLRVANGWRKWLQVDCSNSTTETPFSPPIPPLILAAYPPLSLTHRHPRRAKAKAHSPPARRNDLTAAINLRLTTATHRGHYRSEDPKKFFLSMRNGLNQSLKKSRVSRFCLNFKNFSKNFPRSFFVLFQSEHPSGTAFTFCSQTR